MKKFERIYSQPSWQNIHVAMFSLEDWTCMYNDTLDKRNEVINRDNAICAATEKRLVGLRDLINEFSGVKLEGAK